MEQKKNVRKNVAIATLSLALIATAGLTASSAAHHEDDDQGRAHPHRDGAVLQVIESGDFNAWEDLVAEKELPEQLEALTEADFAKFVEMHELHRAGEQEAANEIREELGLERPERSEHGPGKILEVSYNEWAQKAAERGVEDTSEATFNTLQQAAQLAQSGDREGARALLEEAGIERPHHEERGEKGPGRILEVSYEQWAQKAAERGAEDTSEATFNTLQEAAQLAQSGDREGAKALLDAAGIERPARSERKGNRQGFERDGQRTEDTGPRGGQDQGRRGGFERGGFGGGQR